MQACSEACSTTSSYDRLHVRLSGKRTVPCHRLLEQQGADMATATSPQTDGPASDSSIQDRSAAPDMWGRSLLANARNRKHILRGPPSSSAAPTTTAGTHSMASGLEETWLLSLSLYSTATRSGIVGVEYGKLLTVPHHRPA